jgi:hypothetical protein
MRVLSFLSALIATCSLAFAQVNVAQAGAYKDETTALTTWTLTRTVQRVVQTVTATRNGTEVPVTTTSFGLSAPSASITPYVNGTGVFPTGAGSPAQSAPPYVHTGAGARLGMDVVGLGAVVGLIGLVAL